MINSWPGPANSWEGVDAYFTWADKPGMLVFLTLVTVSYTHLTLPTIA